MHANEGTWRWFLEIFKYMTKATDEQKNVMSYQNFEVLYFALHRVRQIQGYGCFYNIKDAEFDIETADESYDKIIEELNSIEDPVLNLIREDFRIRSNE